MAREIRKEPEKTGFGSNALTQRLSFRMAIGLLIFFILVMSANYYVAETRGRDVMEEQAAKLNREIGHAITLKLKERLAATESLTTALANLGSVLTKDPDEMHRVIPHLMSQAGMEQLIAGGGIWPEPGKFKAGVERSSFFWGRNAQGVLEFYDDYNDPTGNGYHHEEWYVPARYMKQGEVYWSKSYMDPYSLEPMVTCTVGIWENGEFSGVATIDLKLLGLSDFMSEQAKVVGGYAFAVDRNGRLLSFPRSKISSTQTKGLVTKEGAEFPTISELASDSQGFIEIAQVIREMNKYHLMRVHEAGEETLRSLSDAIEKDSYQIEVAEAGHIAAMLLARERSDNETQHFTLASDPLLDEPASVSIFAMPDTGWKVVVTMPERYAMAAVAQITNGMLGLLFLLLTITSILFALFFNKAFLSPIQKLTSQVRKLVSREDYTTKLRTESSNELSQLASWFNIRTAQLGDTLNTLQIKNRDLDEAREEAERANRAKNVFLASMSHEIRTPMNAIIGISDVLARAELDAENSKFVHTINSSAQALLSLINDIMDFSKIEANQLDLESIPFDLRDTLDNCADLIEFEAAEKNLEFVYFMSPDIERRMLGDPGRLRQLILNLVSNAVKFTSSGRVELWVESTSQTNDQIHLHILIKDTGIGISTSAQQDVFSPFTQGDSSTTRKFGGTGLGLAISRHLVELMEGDLEFSSEEGVGTTFVLNLRFDRIVTAYADKVSDTLSPDCEQDMQDSVLLLGRSLFQNAIIERYAQAENFNCIIIDSLQAWIDAISEKQNQQTLSICSDLALLGDLDELVACFPGHMVKHRMILMGSVYEHLDKLASKLESRFLLNFLAMPLKYDDFKSALLAPVEEGGKASQKIATLKPEREEQKANLSALSNKRLLVAEDNKVNQQVLLLLLNNLGLTADLVNDGVEAIEAIRRNSYDLILMDWQMPRMDGLEATRQILQEKGSDSPIIIAVTANAMSGDLDRCLEAGMDDYISKPIRRDKLKAMLEHWL